MRVIIDTDAGVDDSLAIVYAANSPKLQIKMITTVSGNVPVKEVTQNVLLLKELLGLEAPVYSGAEAPLNRELVTAPEVHGEDGVGGYRRSHKISTSNWETRNAAEKIVEAARKLGKNLTIISIGPMTNIASAVKIDVEAMRTVANITQMGGVFFGYGNTTAFTEFNIFVDPDAAHFVLQNGINVRFIPLDITEKLFLPRKMIASLFGSSKHLGEGLKGLLEQATGYYIDYHRKTEKLDGCFLHDPIAIAAATNPKWFKFVDSFVSVETNGDFTAGMTLADLRPDLSGALRETKISRRSRSANGIPLRGDFVAKINSQIAVSINSVKFLDDFVTKVFGAKIAAGVTKKYCLRDRFCPSFSNVIR